MPCYEKIISSPPFQFVIGPNKRIFTLHAAVVAHYSRPLRVLMTGPMSEARERRAALEDVDEETFIRFSQWAYTGDYKPADPKAPDLTETPKTFPSLVFRANEWPTGPSSSESESSGKLGTTYSWSSTHMDFEENGFGSNMGYKTNRAWESFANREYKTSGTVYSPRKNVDRREDYTEVFLSHVRLYVFADKYDISPLRALCLHKLQRTLCEFTLWSERRGDIVKLLQYSYANTPDHRGIGEELRDLVSSYAACKIEILLQSEDLLALIEQEGAFGRDLITQIVPRLN